MKMQVNLSVKVNGLYSPSKDALRGEGTPRLIKCPGEGNLSDVGHFNTPSHVWQLMVKHVDNNGREIPIIARNLALIPCKSPWALLTLKRRLKRGGDTMIYKVPR
jgi:hypothetical protein